MPTLQALHAVGRALYGHNWQQALARDLDVNPRTMRRWIARQNKPPTSIVDDLADLCRERKDELTAIVRQLTK